MCVVRYGLSRLPCALLTVCLLCAVAHAELKQGDRFMLGGRVCEVRLLQSLPFVDSRYASRMVWQRYDDPRLRVLREELRLDNVLLEAKTEFERQIRLMEFVHNLWQYGDPTDLKQTFSPAQIIEHNKREQRFYCEQYACVLAGCAASVGWVCRLVSHDNHTWTDIWSNQHGKWVYLDPTANRWVPGEDGRPLSSAEVRMKTFTAPEPFAVLIGTAPGASTWSGDARFAVIGYHPNTDLLDAPFDYERMFIVHDRHSGAKQNVRGKGDAVGDSLVDPDFPINQAALSLEPAPDGMEVGIRTQTPNFKMFRCRADDGAWRNCGERFMWKLHPGLNVLLAKAVNRFEVDGPLSRVEVWVEGTPGVLPEYAYLGMPAAEEAGKTAGMPEPARIKPTGELEPEPFAEVPEDAWLSRWSTVGHWLEWDLQAPAAGEYEVTFYYQASYYPERELQINGRAVPWLESFTLPSTGSWRNWKKGTLPVKVALREGSNALHITCRDNTYARLQKIVLTGGGHSIRLGALDFAREGGGEVQKTFAVRNGSLYMWDERGHWLEWNVIAPVAGDYDVFLRVAGLQHARRNLTVNGQAAAAPSSAIAPTGGWQVWADVPFGKVRLETGANRARMDNTDGTSLNLNALRFVNADGAEILVNAVDFVNQGGGEVRTRK